MGIEEHHVDLRKLEPIATVYYMDDGDVIVAAHTVVAVTGTFATALQEALTNGDRFYSIGTLAIMRTRQCMKQA